ncbi:hypothetical protein ND486_14415 [Pseudonocardia sp. DR1-2]|uniref:DUF2231 domain-containing protein n=1 Tax=Pseudonocardia sp. DR1-2 TaxID=2951168 RepID=UPI0020440A3E|nr:DUF2231 domain-containing protein [Pseudonocardia sp. DR1-2]MCM3847384.1 hypothetical protein [Pseudonocardia sp. DR1-2]
MESTIAGLPAHILLVHGVVVLVPLTALGLVLVAVWPAARVRLVWPTVVLAAVTLALVPVTTEAGEWLEHRLPRTPLIRAHTELGDGLLPWAAGLAVVAVVVAVRHVVAVRAARRVPATAGGGAPEVPAGPAPGGTVATVVVAVLAVVVAVGAVVTTVRIGDSGARAAWTGQVAEQPLGGSQGETDRG